MSESLETQLGEVLYSAQVEDYYFNETYTNIVYMMKKVVEDEFYREQLYEIGKDDNLDNYGDTPGDYLKKLNKMREKQFGLENTLKQVLWNGQVPEEEFETTFNRIVDMMKKVYEDKDCGAQLYKINLDDYKDEEE